ncbi:G protein pathway suppressor 2 isoform X4 [Drosophila pseudoobscura]|uniref:G protein pathway suppressor 2 isoform X4 n=1 Tax=Drosophila pseudoobscura pseudoobscura TaxID=46245 RepID=A0A6I8VTF2_DROPS|nr:G protein pathway suppressor 2 isoform X4 [Drosophila pseudoobscura]
MPPASAVNSNNAAAQAAKAERAEKLRGALRKFIVADRQRRQGEYDAYCEQMRVRREEEERERENQQALEETRDEITKLDEQLADLHSQKHQLLVQLKKVLNEDETRKKQAKENELFAMQQAAATVATSVFLPTLRLQHHQQLAKPPPGNQSGKRGRSPSPPNHAYYKSTASFAQQKTTAQYPSTGTLFYQTTAAPPTTQQQADARLPAIYNYALPLRQAYHVELPSATVSKASDTQSPKAQPMQVLHINLDQPPISQSDLVVQATSVANSLSIQTSKPQVTMEKLPERYHIEVKHDGAPQNHVPPPPHLLSEGVIFKPMMSELSMHPNVLQISTSQNSKTTGSITQGFPPGRGSSGHEGQLNRQQLSLLPGQTATPPVSSSGPVPPAAGQQLQYARRLY